jgi:hypothetical protein
MIDQQNKQAVLYRIERALSNNGQAQLCALLTIGQVIKPSIMIFK